MIEIKNFSKSYNGNLVLEIPSLHIPEGIHSLAGRNGSGKTTLLKCIAGILPFKGHISIEGIANSKKSMKEYLKQVRYSPAEPVFPSFLRSVDLIKFYSSLLPTESSEINYIKQELGVNRFEDVEIGHYSSGMLKKLSLTLSFMGNSKVIILDEPFNALDVEACEKLNEMIATRRASGTSFIITSHQSNLDQPLDSELHVGEHQLVVNESAF